MERTDVGAGIRHTSGSWQAERNGVRATIEWMFDLDRARTKLGRAYEAARPDAEAAEAA